MDSKRYRLFQYIRHLKGLAAYYPLNEVTGTVARNYAPATINTLQGTTSNAGIGKTGLLGRSYDFNGTNNNVEIIDAAPLKPDTLTVFALCRADTFGGSDFLNNIVSREGANTGFSLRAGNQQANFMVATGSGTPQAKDASQTLVASKWTLVAGTYDGTDIKVYVNGALRATQASASIGHGTANLQIGNTPLDSARNFDGKIQHVGLVNRALSLTEIQKVAHLAGLI